MTRSGLFMLFVRFAQLTRRLHVQEVFFVGSEIVVDAADVALLLDAGNCVGAADMVTDSCGAAA